MNKSHAIFAKAVFYNTFAIVSLLQHEEKLQLFDHIVSYEKIGEASCAGLHNFLRRECRSDEFPPAPDEDTTNETDESYEWDDTQTQDQQREKANEWRLNLANEMWATTNSENS
ncbi:hypothetical protein DM860_015016 [Cuscuta australis]|uniref:Uncharacterized protein n=1 Tax=Cuscuta australis TaxID=267555 RepID=A0A328DE73_9ASTE|nr:hypothetical protein DM860_015016 [Cuscuta australis]